MDIISNKQQNVATGHAKELSIHPTCVLIIYRTKDLTKSHEAHHYLLSDGIEPIFRFRGRHMARLWILIVDSRAGEVFDAHTLVLPTAFSLHAALLADWTRRALEYAGVKGRLALVPFSRTVLDQGKTHCSKSDSSYWLQSHHFGQLDGNALTPAAGGVGIETARATSSGSTAWSMCMVRLCDVCSVLGVDNYSSQV